MADSPSNTERCLDCGKVVPADMPYCPSCGKRMGDRRGGDRRGDEDRRHEDKGPKGSERRRGRRRSGGSRRRFAY